jgi:hypothetical protein
MVFAMIMEGQPLQTLGRKQPFKIVVIGNDLDFQENKNGV